MWYSVGKGGRYAVHYWCYGAAFAHPTGVGNPYAFLTAGTGIPAILRFTEPRKFQLVK
jgi:hypothetical protein